MKEDNLPIEIIDNLYIGSIGAASNKEGLKSNNITHVIVAAGRIEKFFPDVKFYFFIFRILNIFN